MRQFRNRLELIKDGRGSTTMVAELRQIERHREMPRSPAPRISRITRLRATAVPSACSSACTHGVPEVPCNDVWIVRIRRSSAAAWDAQNAGVNRHAIGTPD